MVPVLNITIRLALSSAGYIRCPEEAGPVRFIVTTQLGFNEKY